MKFLHTADWQIGMKFVHLGQHAETARLARLQAAGKVLKIASLEKVDFVLLGGDTFEDNAVQRSKVREVAQRLGSVPCPVYVIPGNHDPVSSGSVWEDDCWQRHENVRILLEAKPVSLPGGGTLFPCPALGKYSTDDPTAWIKTSAGDGIRLGLAHGSVIGNPDIEPSFPVPQDAPERRGLDYLALGHYHSTKIYKDSAGSERMAYSGTHEPSGFGERDSGNVLIIEIAEAGATPSVTRVETGVLQWIDVAREVRDTVALAAVRAELERIPEPEHVLVRCGLRGFADGAAFDVLEEIRDLLAGRFVYGELDCPGLELELANPDWMEGLPPGYLREAARALCERASGDPVALHALQDFRRIWKEVRA